MTLAMTSFAEGSLPMYFKRSILAVAAGLLLPSPVFAQAEFSGAGATTELDCDGGTAKITGATNTVRVTGKCARLEIQGAGNEVRVELAPKGVISIVGASNVVVWSTPDGSKARTSIQGADNRVSQAK